VPSSPPCLEVFVRCADAIRRNKLISRESKQDKEFHFQNWFKARLAETRLKFEVGGRNTYPDFRLVASTDGFEVRQRECAGDFTRKQDSRSRLRILWFDFLAQEPFEITREPAVARPSSGDTVRSGDRVP
jgi:hypothetical protein